MPKYSNFYSLAVPTIGVSNSLFFNIAFSSSTVFKILLILTHLSKIGEVSLLGYYCTGLAFKGL